MPGVALAVAGAMLLMPIHRARGQVYVPGDILAATGLDREAFLSGSEPAATGRAVEAFGDLGREHLARARSALAGSAGGLSGLSAGGAGRTGSRARRGSRRKALRKGAFRRHNGAGNGGSGVRHAAAASEGRRRADAAAAGKLARPRAD